MEGARVQVLCLLTLLLLSTAAADPPRYVLTQYCQNGINVDSSAILEVDGWYAENQECSVTIRADYSPYGNSVRLEILHFRAACEFYEMTLYDGDPNYGSKMADNLCGHLATENKKFLTTTISLTIVLTARQMQTTNFRIKLLATNTYRFQPGSDFQCDNQFFIDPILRCDGYDNCGDDSDEARHLCRDRGYKWSHRHLIIVLVSCAGGVLIFLVLVLLIRRRRRNGAILPKSAGTQPYCPIQGESNPGFQPASNPPPYGAVNDSDNVPASRKCQQ